MRAGITRRDFMKYSALGTALTPALGCHAFASGSDRPERPNIVMYISDDHGVDFVGCYGNADVRTPNIDALANEGMRFARLFAASPTCAPSRSALWTGLYPAHNGCMGNHTTCRADVTTLPSYLKQLGYRVVLANKRHAKPWKAFDFEYINAALPRNAAHPRKYRREGLDAKAVDALLAEHRASQPKVPLCLIVADSSPHVTWEPNQTYDLAKLKLPPFIVDTPMTRRAMANYYQDITTMDTRVGAVRASLKKHGFEDNTLFIYTTDQGSEWPHSKWTLYDAGIRVPFVAVWPGVIRPGEVCDAMISFVDVTPTFIAGAGGARPEGMDGRSFLPVLRGKERHFRDTIYATHTRDANMNVFPQRCVRDQRYKYILNLYSENTWTTHWTKVPDLPESHKEVWDTWVEKAAGDPHAARIVKLNEQHPPEELYDTEVDPYELNNVARNTEMRPVLLRMRRQLKQWLIEQGETMPDGDLKTWGLDEIRIRDPFILADEATQTYYLYAQMDNRVGKTDPTKGVEVYTSRDLGQWEGPWPAFATPDDFWAQRMVWAPEVHKYRDRWYLLVTFTAHETLGTNSQGRPLDKRGTQVLVADSPKGPFQPFKNGPHTPADWMALDGTLWVEDGTPWMVFCHEWVQTTDGTIELVRLKDDLSDVAGSPVTLFRATDALWVKSLKDLGGRHHGYVTDGPFLQRTKTGKLLMIWSSFGAHHYAVGLASSTSGKIAGPWKQQAEPLFAANGGHGMIFRTFDGRLMLALHQPNSGNNERARFFELQDTGDSLALKP